MRGVVSVALPLMLLAVITAQSPGSKSAKSYDLISYACKTCDRQLVVQAVAYEDCQKAAYTMNDGADVFLSVLPRNTQKFECRPVH